MRKKLSFGLVLALFLLLAAGCRDKIAPLWKIPLVTADYQSGQLAMQVGPGGVIHIARTECPTGSTSQCRLVVTKHNGASFVNRLVPEAPLPNVVNRTDPDVAVTDSGVAYYVLRLHYDNGVVKDYWRSDQFGDFFYPLDNNGLKSTGPPKVAARGETVYALYQALDLTLGTVLKYKQLAGGTHSGTLLPVSEVLESDLVLAPGDKLFASFLAIHGGVQGAGFCEVPALTGLYTCPLNDGPEYEAMPTLRLDETGSVLSFALVRSSKYEPLTLMRCPTNDCVPHLVQDLYTLPSEEHWTITSPVCLATSPTATFVAFTAWNTRLPVGQTEVYRYIYMPGTTTGPPAPITDNSEVESAPQCAYYSDGAEAGDVIGWRIVSQDAFGSVYIWDAINGTRRVHQGISDGRTGFLMDGRGRYLAGIANLLTGSQVAPWVSFNADLVYLPSIRR